MKSTSVATGLGGFTLVAALTAAGLSGGSLKAQVPQSPLAPIPLASLKTVSVPEPPDLSLYVRDKAAAIRLGKALFWEMQAGSDGVEACASCHFNAGADPRLKNQLNPALFADDFEFAAPAGPNFTLKASDFPFHKLANVDDRNSQVLAERNDIAGSQGVFRQVFQDVVPGNAVDRTGGVFDADFHVGTFNVRRVSPRNSPTVINAVFNFRNLWDGTAQNEFNGVSPLGARDHGARVLRVVGGRPQPVPILIASASLASQAVGPPLNSFEMSAESRTFPKLGKKLLSLIPLGKQLVHASDSALGPLSATRYRPLMRGLRTTYEAMIQEAFQPAWWDSSMIVTFDDRGQVAGVLSRPARPLTTNEFTMMEANFSLFWGLAIQLYEATLVADDTPFDRFMAGNRSALTAQQQRGLDLFINKGRCIQCHGGPELTNASVTSVANRRLLRMTMGDGRPAVYDNGFYNIGVRPTGEDLGVGGLDSFSNPLSDTKMALLGKFSDPNLTPSLRLDERAAVRGNFKVPSLRNAELTGPYYHNGGQATLLQVVEFYNRGGDFAQENAADLDANIQPLGLTRTEKLDLVAFLKALTDDRVRLQKGPFDHPELIVPNGHSGNQSFTMGDGSGNAKDTLLAVPSVGTTGSAALKPVFPQ